MTEQTITLPDGRVMAREEFDTARKALSAPFPVAEIEKLPKQMKRDDNDKGSCARGSRYSADGHYCGGYHARSIHLDYIGHAGITMRLNSVDPFWTWEPMSLTEVGTPRMTDDGMWIKLTVLGVTRIGYGDPAGKRGANAVKEVIGDALRNAAMRHGVGTYLWSKSDAAAALKVEADDETPPPAVKATTPKKSSPTAKVTGRDWEGEVDVCTDTDTLRELWKEAAAAGDLISGNPLEAVFKSKAAVLTASTGSAQSDVVKSGVQA